ncbi:transporter substrate-binding domain-containing protein [Actinophytocola sp.]|uniref:transporter substrate-binding domain-containing protein n=1 Tax=Actinophytocola sp. TaxID=1872138 RepID=UPI003D6B2F05
MAWTRRQFLYGTTVLGAAVTAGCSSRVGGTPRADPRARPAAEASSSAPEAPAQMIIGVLEHEPFVTQEGPAVTGQVPEVARAVLDQLGVADPEFKLMPTSEVLHVALVAGELDMVGGMIITRNACAGVTFSVPDFVSGTALIVPLGNPKGLADYADIKAKGAKVAVLANLPEQADAAAAGVPRANVILVPDPTEMVDSVRRGRADCAAFDDIGSRSLIRSAGNDLAVEKPFSPPKRLPTVGAFAFSENASGMLDSFNNRLRDLHESGDWLAISSPFGFTEANVPPPDLTTERACTGP